MTDHLPRLANIAGRAHLLVGDGAIDVELRSDGRLPSDPMAVLELWDELRAWTAGAIGDPMPFDPKLIGPAVPRPRQLFAIGLNYADHAAETGRPLPESPLVFTKFPSCIAAPSGPLTLPTEHVDWEVELVAVIGRGGRHIAEADALAHVAGFCVGQDFSERVVQRAGSPAQFSMGKSFAGFGPIGPAIVDRDALPAGLDLAITCEVDGEVVQRSRTSKMIFSVPVLVAYLSSICELLPGDVIFTGTPDGVGIGRTPPRFLQPGNVVVSTIEGIGELRTECVAPA
jgi:2-keto-4-pentenoate hydratase/2-oxohepta-3-ene-1,7-dioic acid hydratase in catechol pathway